MAYARLYIPYNGAGNEHDYAAFHNDLIRVITGATDFTNFELAIDATSAFIVTTEPAGWEVVRTEYFPATTTEIYAPTGSIYVSNNYSISNSTATLLRSLVDGYTDQYKYVCILTGLRTKSPTAGTRINIHFIPVDFDDGTVWGGVLNKDNLTGSWARGWSNMCAVNRNEPYYLDISVSAKHISLFPMQINNSYAVPVLFMQRTVIQAEDGILNGFSPMVLLRGGLSKPSDTLAFSAIPDLLSDGGMRNTPLTATFGGNVGQENINSVLEATYISGGTRVFLFVKPTVYDRIIQIGDIHPDVPIHWVSKGGTGALSSYSSGSELITDGVRYIMHGSFPATNLSYPMFIEVR